MQESRTSLQIYQGCVQPVSVRQLTILKTRGSWKTQSLVNFRSVIKRIIVEHCIFSLLQRFFLDIEGDKLKSVYTMAKGRYHEIPRALEPHLKAVPQTIEIPCVPLIARWLFKVIKVGPTFQNNNFKISDTFPMTFSHFRLVHKYPMNRYKVFTLHFTVVYFH